MFQIEAVIRGLEKGQDGIWHAARTSEISYPEHGNESCFEVEEESFWFNHRNACILELIDAFPPENNDPIFDIGGGNGFVSQAIMKSGREAVLIEPGRAGAANARKRGLPHVICAAIDKTNFVAGSIGAAGLFDVIEHIDDDREFLRVVRELLRVGGRLYVTVPAYSFLWSSDDEAAGHYRRYTLQQISAVLSDAGFVVDYGTYLFRPLPFAIFMLRTLPYKLGRSGRTHETKPSRRDHASSGSWKGRLVSASLRSEVHKVRKQQKMAFGGSCLLSARKR